MALDLITEPYLSQLPYWPDSGQHILAQFDDETIVVYQAYRSSIGRFAAENQVFGGEFSYTRMSWIKTNFLWMMYRSGWGAKPDQEVTLAVRLKRSFFEQVLENAVASTYSPDRYGSQDEWKQRGARSDVRLQWDPDHDPIGRKQERRAVQLGLRGDTLAEYGKDAIVDIVDISDFVAKQRASAHGHFERLMTPSERVYTPLSAMAAANVGLTPSYEVG